MEKTMLELLKNNLPEYLEIANIKEYYKMLTQLKINTIKYIIIITNKIMIKEKFL